MRLKEGSFTSVTKQQLFFRHWLPERHPKGMVTLVHGYAEHSGRYEEMARSFTGEGLGVAAFDLVGHGKSGGRPGYIDSIDDCIADLGLFRRLVAGEYPGIEHPILGHSMGGAVVILSILARAVRTNAAVLSSPSIHLSEAKWLQKASTLLSRFAPTIPTISFDRSLIARDISVVNAAKADPLNYEGPVLLRTGAEIARAAERINTMMEAFDTPFLIIHGTADKIVKPSGSQEFFDSVQSTDKSIRLYDGLYHETFNEVDDGPRVVGEITEWLVARI